MTQAGQNSAEQIRNTQDTFTGWVALPVFLYINDWCFVTQLESASWERKRNLRLQRFLNQQLRLASRNATGRIILRRAINTVLCCVSH